MKKESGITLVSMVITIIVLMILAAITVNAVVGGGILDKTEQAIDENNEGEIKEKIKLVNLEYSIVKFTDKDKTKLDHMQERLNEVFADEVVVTKNGKGYKIRIGDTNVVYKLKDNGEIEKYEEMKSTKVYARLDDDGNLYLRATQLAGYNLYSSSASIQANWNSAGTANRESVKKVIIEEKIAPLTARNMFYNCINLISIENMENLCTENVTNMSYMFYLCKSMQNIDVSMWDTSNVTDMSGMFNRCRIVETLDIAEFDTSNVTNMSGMFVECSKVKELDVRGFDTAKVTNMSSMFSSCAGLESLDVSGFDTSQVTNMSDMFYCCTKLEKLDVSNFNTSQVTNMSKMFNRCRIVKELDVSKFNTSQVTNMSTMFYECSKVKKLDVSSFETSQVTNMSGMFGVCNSLTDLNMGILFEISEGINFDNMFDRFNIVKIKAKQTLIDKLKSKFESFTDNNFIVIE